ncbi:MAG TPA: PLP-dependent aminotransferase family protein [Pyrinomonadaceae bacterium]|nr:PLP-dependent aminotransferase family protein [Pyrinomonadaceae bacterium]
MSTVTLPAGAPPGAEQAMARWTRAAGQSELRRMLSLTTRPGLLSLALGLPAPELFPREAYGEAARRALEDDALSLQYGPPYRRLRGQLAELMRRRGVDCREEQIFLTAGAQQGMALLARLLLEPGGEVVLEEISYTGMQIVLEPFEPRVLTVPTDLETGLDVGAVEALLEGGARPAFIYAMTEAHNPLGVSLAAEKRARLAGLARRYRVPVVEDDVYGFLSYDAPAPPPLRGHDDEWVFYVGSLSKILAPSLRVGWVVVPEWMTPKLSLARDASDLDVASFSQRVVSNYLATGHLEEHLPVLRREYAARRDTMLAALGEHMPAGTRWHRPPGGLFVWVELPEGIDTGELLELAVETERVAFVPGHAFRSGAGLVRRNCMRLNFSNCDHERIRDAAARLGRAVERLGHFRQ